MKIDDMEFTVRTYCCLKRAGIETVEELVSMSDEKLMRVQNLSSKGLMEIREKTKAFQIQQAASVIQSAFSDKDSELHKALVESIADVLKGLPKESGLYDVAENVADRIVGLEKQKNQKRLCLR